VETLQGKFILSGILTTFTSLAIAQDQGNDSHSNMPSMVVRHPISGTPWIPGSSLRGALRRIFEKQAPKAIPIIFGISGKDPAVYPGRAIIRDLIPVESTHQRPSVNVQTYMALDRVTAQSTLYAIEQIPAGSHFHFEILFSTYEKADLATFIQLLEALAALEQSSLGNQGSRGMGKIQWGAWKLDDSGCIQPELTSGLQLNWRPKAYYEHGTSEKVLFAGSEKCLIADFLQQKNKIEAVLS